MEVKMVATCAMPECGHKFHQLSKGRLFLLPPLQDSSLLMWRVETLANYCYWLCAECSLEYTIEREGTELTVSKRELSTSTCASTLRVISNVAAASWG